MSFVGLLHRSTVLRQLARRICRGLTIRQRFHGGRIYLDAVDHSWAWTGAIRYQTFDPELQECLLRLSHRHAAMIDIGANIGAMSLSVLLRNPVIRIVAVEPNPRAASLLQRSLDYNRLQARARLVHAACTPSGATTRFDFSGSVAGHISVDAPTEVAGTTVSALFDLLPAAESPLVKVDVEGFETQLLGELIKRCQERRATLVIELHPLGWNAIGDPEANFAALHASGADIRALDGSPLVGAAATSFMQVVATWERS
ncbi:MAG TPA: FkbM family methyltransferase [Opitutus sp.]|nr:FkbM family methyltransferase [Opitutus sp.]